MPIYEYRCESCARTCEIFVKSKDEAIRCPTCGHTVLTKLLSTFSARDGDGGHDHAGGGCSCCPSARTCPSARGDR